MMSISLLSLRSVFINCSGSLWMPTQQPLTKIFVALLGKKQNKIEFQIKGFGRWGSNENNTCIHRHTSSNQNTQAILELERGSVAKPSSQSISNLQEIFCFTFITWNVDLNTSAVYNNVIWIQAKTI